MPVFDLIMSSENADELLEKEINPLLLADFSVTRLKLVFTIVHMLC